MRRLGMTFEREARVEDEGMLFDAVIRSPRAVAPALGDGGATRRTRPLHRRGPDRSVASRRGTPPPATARVPGGSRIRSRRPPVSPAARRALARPP